MQYLVMLGLMVLLSGAVCTGQDRTVVEVFPDGQKEIGRQDSSVQSIPDDAQYVTIRATLSSFGSRNVTEFGAEYSLDGGSTWHMLTFGRTAGSDRRPTARASFEASVRRGLPDGTGRQVRSWLVIEENRVNSKLELVYE